MIHIGTYYTNTNETNIYDTNTNYTWCSCDFEPLDFRRELQPERAAAGGEAGTRPCRTRPTTRWTRSRKRLNAESKNACRTCRTCLACI
jgi:hypothetical protein